MAKTKRPGLRVNDLVTPRFSSIPAYGGKPHVSKFTVLRVSGIGGTGSERNPWYATVTDDAGSTWTLPPSDFLPADAADAASIVGKERHHMTKARSTEVPADVLEKALAKVAQSNKRQSIWLTNVGEFRIRDMSEKVSPLWTFVRHVPSDDDMRSPSYKPPGHHLTKKKPAQLAREVDDALAKGSGGDRVLADLKSWGIDNALLGEVRDAFRSGNHRLAMALARDLGWNRASKRGRAFR